MSSRNKDDKDIGILFTKFTQLLQFWDFKCASIQGHSKQCCHVFLQLPRAGQRHFRKQWSEPPIPKICNFIDKYDAQLRKEKTGGEKREQRRNKKK